jgi:hypothetical protein
VTVVVHQRSGGGVANASGVAYVGSDGYADAVSAYAWATVAPTGPCDACTPVSDGDTTSPDVAITTLPLIGSRAEMADGLVYFGFFFAAPPGVHICTHISIVRTGS